MGPISSDHRAGRGDQRRGDPSTDGFPRGGDGGFPGFHDEGCGGDGHDEQEDDVTFELRLALEFLRREHNTANQGQHAADKSDDVADLNHQIPRTSDEFREHFL